MPFGECLQNILIHYFNRFIHSPFISSSTPSSSTGSFESSSWEFSSGSSSFSWFGESSLSLLSSSCLIDSSLVSSSLSTFTSDRDRDLSLSFSSDRDRDLDLEADLFLASSTWFSVLSSTCDSFCGLEESFFSSESFSLLGDLDPDLERDFDLEVDLFRRRLKMILIENDLVCANAI